MATTVVHSWLRFDSSREKKTRPALLSWFYVICRFSITFGELLLEHAAARHFASRQTEISLRIFGCNAASPQKWIVQSSADYGA